MTTKQINEQRKLTRIISHADKYKSSGEQITNKPLTTKQLYKLQDLFYEKHPELINIK